MTGSGFRIFKDRGASLNPSSATAAITCRFVESLTGLSSLEASKGSRSHPSIAFLEMRGAGNDHDAGHRDSKRAVKACLDSLIQTPSTCARFPLCKLAREPQLVSGICCVNFGERAWYRYRAPCRDPSSGRLSTPKRSRSESVTVSTWTGFPCSWLRLSINLRRAPSAGHGCKGVAMPLQMSRISYS